MLIFERLHASRIADLQIPVLLFPVIERRARDAVAADPLRGRSARSVLLQNRDDLLGRASGLLPQASGRPTVDAVGPDCLAHFGGNSGGALSMDYHDPGHEGFVSLTLFR